MARPPGWRRSPFRVELQGLYAETDALLEGWECACTKGLSHTAPCCDFRVIGREPYPTALELEDVRHAVLPGRLPSTARPLLPPPATSPFPLSPHTARSLIY